MASDSSSTSNGTIVVRAGVPKVWKVTCGIELIIGFCGNFGNGQWIRHGFKWPQYDGRPFFHWLVGVLQPALRRSFVKRFGSDYVDLNSWQLMVGAARPARLFVLSPCGDVEESLKPYACIGSAIDVAKGALEVLEAHDMDPWDRLEAAMRAAKEFHCDVAGPTHIEALVCTSS
jgi:ATP-dependent protease HslVU (ClpYQ) peptidase subunit